MEKIALVTGSTNNIGKAIAEVLAGQGFHVIVTSRHGEEAKRVSENLSKKGSWFAVDFSEVSAVENLFNFVKDKFQRLDVLVNNVAYTKNESISDCDLTTWEYTTCVQPLSATLGFEDLRRGFESETFSRTVIEPVFDLC